VLYLVTFGIYSIYWFYKTKEELNKLGGKIPTFILYFIPIANLYWLYKYCEAFTKCVRKKESPLLWFFFVLFLEIVFMPVVQMELNKLA